MSRFLVLVGTTSRALLGRVPLCSTQAHFDKKRNPAAWWWLFVCFWCDSRAAAWRIVSYVVVASRSRSFAAFDLVIPHA